jgi:hypothetical protein
MTEDGGSKTLLIISRVRQSARRSYPEDLTMYKCYFTLIILTYMNDRIKVYSVNRHQIMKVYKVRWRN